MKKIAIFAPEIPGEVAVVNVPGLPAKCPAGESETPAARPGVSVVAKVAKLLISRGRDPLSDDPVSHEQGLSHHKVLMTLQAKQSGP